MRFSVIAEKGLSKVHEAAARMAGIGAVNRLMRERCLLALQCLALFLVIAGVRAWIVGEYGSDLPYWDQWGTEGWGLFRGYFNGTLTLSDWFAPSNEHRVFFTRLVALALLLVNGQWDARLEMLTNSLFYSLVGCGLFLIFARSRSLLFGTLWWLAIAVVFVLPFGWENTIAGFQSCFYLLVAFSLAAIWLLGNFPAWSPPWFAGVLIGFAALFTMASGLMAPLAILGLLCLTLAREWRNWRVRLQGAWPTALACVLVTAAGFSLMVVLEGHDGYRAQSVGQFMEAFAACLAWPNNGHNWWAILNWLPFIAFVAAYMVGSVPEDRQTRFTIGIGIWLLLQAAATAYSRATIVYSSRYSDMLSLGIFANVLSFSLLWQAWRPASRLKLLFIPLFLAWLAVNAQGLYAQSFNGALGARKFIYDVEKANTGAYVITGNFEFLVPKQDRKEIPCPTSEGFAQILQDPILRPLLPVSVSEPLHMGVARGNPVVLGNRDYNGELAPYPWERLWGFPPSGNGGAPDKSACAAVKKRGLPYLYMFVAGGCDRLVVTDAEKRPHPVIPFSGKDGGGWQLAYAYCPGPQCLVSAPGNGQGVVFSEPKEMGILSLWTLLLVGNAHYLFISGAVMFGCAMILAFLKHLSATARGDAERSLNLKL